MKTLLRSAFLVFMLLCSILVGYIQLCFNQYTAELSQKNQTKEIWSHRGVHHTLQENTLEAFQLAKDQNFKGIEIDVFFDRGKFIVSHDEPYQLVNGELLMLETVFNQLGSEMKYWIDLKNLDLKNQSEIISIFETYFNMHQGLKEHVYIESGNGLALRKLSQNGFNCIYWVQFSRKKPIKFLKLIYLKAMILSGKFENISSDFRFANKNFRKHFKHLNWYVFTVDEQLVIDRFMRFEETTVILTDLDGKDVIQNE